MIKQLLACLTIGLASGPALAQASIERVAPENSVVVFGMKDASSTLRQLTSSPIFQIWTGAGAAAPGDEAGAWIDMLPAPLPELLADLRGAGGKVPTPKGSAGLAMFTAIDPEIGMPTPEFLVFADFGEQAEELMTRVSRLAERAGPDGRVTFERREVEGAEVLSLHLPVPEPEPFDPMADPMMGDQGMNPMSMLMPDPERFRIDTVHLTRSGPNVLMGSELASLRRGVMAIDGRNELGVIADNRAFQGAIKQVGDSDAYGVVLTRDILQLVMGPDTMGMAMMFQPMARAAFGEVQAIGYGMSGGNATSPSTQRMTLYMPNGKQGLTSLIDKPLPRAEPPVFLGDGAVSFTAFNIDFMRVSPVVQAFMQSNPMMQMQFAEPWQKMRPALERTAASLGSRAYMVQSASKAGAENGSPIDMLMAVECANPQAFSASFDEFASRMGLARHDAGGRVLFTPGDDPAQPGGPGPMGGMLGMAAPPMAVGIGEQYVFMGMEQQVRAALGGAGQAAAGGHDGTPAYRRAMAMLPDEPIVAWGFTDTARLADLAGGMFPAGQQPAGMPVDPQAISRLVGPSVWYIKSTPEGFVNIAHQLPPPQAVHVEDDGPEN